MTSIRELSTLYILASVFPDHLNCFGLEYIEMHLGAETDDDVQPIGVVRQMDRFVIECLFILLFECFVVVDAQSVVCTEGGDVLLAHAHVKAVDFM